MFSHCYAKYVHIKNLRWSTNVYNNLKLFKQKEQFAYCNFRNLLGPTSKWVILTALIADFKSWQLDTQCTVKNIYLITWVNSTKKKNPKQTVALCSEVSLKF